FSGRRCAFRFRSCWVDRRRDILGSRPRNGRGPRIVYQGTVTQKEVRDKHESKGGKPMIVREPQRLVEADSICFALMYRCLECGSVVRGQKTDDGMTCEKCETPLDEDDEIALRLDDED